MVTIIRYLFKLGKIFQNKIQLPTLNTIDILGYPNNVKFLSFKLNGKSVQINTQKSTYYTLKRRLLINTLALIDLNRNGPAWILTWDNL